MSVDVVLEAFSAVLPSTARTDGRARDDGSIEVDINGQPIIAVWTARGWPKQVEEATERHDNVDVLVAPSVSEGARKMLEDRGVGWVEQTGAASFAVGPVVVERDAQVRREDSASASTWRPSTFAVAEALLLGEVGTVAAVAARTELSQGTVTRSMRVLTDLGLLEARSARGRNARRRVENPDLLLERYAAEAERAGLPEPCVTIPLDPSDPVDDLLELVSAWDRSLRLWAATGALSAMFQAPYLQRPAPIQLYVDVQGASGLAAAARELGRELMDGGRLSLRPFPSSATARLSDSATTETAMWCVPWPRTYADLRLEGVRGEEAAEHLRARYLDSWKGPT